MPQSVEIILAEFGVKRLSAGDVDLPDDRLEPALSSFGVHFPEATATVYTDQQWTIPDVTCVQVDPPFRRDHPRYGWRANDYYKAIGLRNSKADVAIYVDADMVALGPQVRYILGLAASFGLCLPHNGRLIAGADAQSGCDGGPLPGRCAYQAAYNGGFWAIGKRRTDHVGLLEAYCDQIIDDAGARLGARGPLCMARAVANTGIYPYLLPFQWCVTTSSVEMVKHVAEASGIEPAVAHVGQEAVHKVYGGE